MTSPRRRDGGDAALSSPSEGTRGAGAGRERTDPDRRRSGRPPGSPARPARPAGPDRPERDGTRDERPATPRRSGAHGRRSTGDDSSGPLAASWDVGRRPRALPRPPRRRTWAIYLVPLLVVITVLAVVQTVRAGDDTGGGTEGTATGVGGASEVPPVVGEAPRGTVEDVNIPTAELPPGGVFPVRGRGTWHVLPGAGPQAGSGRVFTYTVEVEDGATLPEGDDAFAAAVDATLSDPRSWVGSQRIAMRRIDASARVAPDFRVSLTSQLTTREQCGYAIRFDASCWKSDAGRVLINAARWVRGGGAFDGQLGLYRQYAVNHEVGHVFRNPHVPCDRAGGLAPVMMQQSFGTANDYLAQLTEENPQGRQIPRDGKVCQPNPWPYPEGAIAPAG